MRFKNKTALITGGGTGIGAAVARRIAAEGGKVALVGRRVDPLRAVAEEIGGLRWRPMQPTEPVSAQRLPG